MDILDEKLIVDAIAGVVSDELVYSFELNGKTVKGLTIFGTVLLAREVVDRGCDLLCEKPVAEEREKSFKGYCKMIYVSPNGHKLEVWGTKIQSKTIKLRKTGEIVDNPNAEDIAMTKAQRNAILKIIPPKTGVELIERVIASGKGIKRVSQQEIREIKEIRQVGASVAVSPEQKQSQEKAHSTSPENSAPSTPQKSPEEQMTNSLTWFTGEGKSRKKWEPGCESGFSNVKFGDEGISNIAKPLVKAIKDAKNELRIGSEIFTYDETKGQVWRELAEPPQGKLV